MRHVLCTSAEQAGRESGLIRRERKLTGATFVQSLVFGWIENPQATVTERAQMAYARGVRISAYGLEKRLDDERACECLRLVLGRAMREVIMASASPAAIPILGRFSGVYLYDASVVGLPEVIKERWPGTGCGAGPTASVKVGARLDLLSGELYVPPMRAGREHDRTMALEAEAMPEGALRLADLGFFDLGLLARLSAEGCYWLTRLMARTAIYEPESAVRLDLARTLSALQRSGQKTLEIKVLVGAKARLPARLLAARVVRRRALTLACALENPRRLARVLGDIARCLQRGCRVDKRRKEPGTAQQLLALTNAAKEATIA